MKYALLSVSDKTGIVELAQALVAKGYSILSTGGTAKKLQESNIEVTEISEFTGQKEILGGRVKTLHPKIFAGILADPEQAGHSDQMTEAGFDMIDVVAVNLYPFLETVKANKSFEEVVEQVDIGGPSLIRAAAKNHTRVSVLTDPSDYQLFTEKLNADQLDASFRKHLMNKAFESTARYDVIINNYFSKQLEPESYPEHFNFTFEKVQDLRYGENPHQQAALYKPYMPNETGVAQSKQLQGKQLSYNNILDGNEALNIVKDFDIPTVAIIKHTNPSGVASADNVEVAYEKALAADPKSAFGSVIAMNKECTTKCAELMSNLFVEIVIAPCFEKGALDVFSKKKNLRILETGTFFVDEHAPQLRRIDDGLLVQSKQFPSLKKEDLKVVTKRAPTEKEIEDLLFAWKVNKHVKSNSIVFAKDQVTVGIGAGQMSRVDAVNLVSIKEEANPANSVMSSDAFFPFRDGLDQAVKAGATAIIQPGGSVRDEEVIAAADEHGIAMVFTGVRLFKH